MAQIVTITNPLTGQPTQVDQLEHTAQQIDDAIARALPGGAIDISLANKAPAGYGYGEVITCYNFTENYSEFTSKLDAILSGMKDGEAKQIIIYDSSLSYTQTSCTARLLCDDGGTNAVLTTDFDRRGQAMVYRKQNGIWQPPEYVNPPMLLGVEYRTTERYLGKPVYVKVVNCGEVPGNTIKTIGLNASNVDVPLSATGYLARTIDTYKFSVPYLMTDTNKAITQGVSLNLRNDNNNTGAIVIQTHITFSNEYILYAIARYTKTTD